MRKLVAIAALVCAVALSVSAGPGELPGAEPTPTPTPCEGCFAPDGSGTNSVAPPFVVIFVDGEFIIVWS